MYKRERGATLCTHAPASSFNTWASRALRSPPFGGAPAHDGLWSPGVPALPCLSSKFALCSLLLNSMRNALGFASCHSSSLGCTRSKNCGGVVELCILDGVQPPRRRLGPRARGHTTTRARQLGPSPLGSRKCRLLPKLVTAHIMHAGSWSCGTTVSWDFELCLASLVTCMMSSSTL